MKKPTVTKCYRCGKRCRNPELWNVDMVAGLYVGAVCRGCQTVEESLGADVNAAMCNYSDLTVQNRSEIETLIYALLRTYPTHEVMRGRADVLAAARKDAQAAEMVKMMRMLADGMESGDLYAD